MNDDFDYEDEYFLDEDELDEDDLYGVNGFDDEDEDEDEEDFYFSFLLCFYVVRCRGGCFSGTAFCPLAGESGRGVVFFPHRACDTAFRTERNAPADL